MRQCDLCEAAVVAVELFAWLAFADFFGREHLGSISGVTTAILVLGSALGPFPFGACKDATGSFDGAIVGSVMLCFATAAVAIKWGDAPPSTPPLTGSPSWFELSFLGSSAALPSATASLSSSGQNDHALQPAYSPVLSHSMDDEDEENEDEENSVSV